VRVGGLFLCFSILLQKRYRLLGDGCLMLFRTFFIAFSAARHVFPSEISYAKLAAGDSNLCMNLFASASALFKHRKNRKGTPGFERNAIKKNTPQ
jgi:hypothetical protein